MTLRTLRQDTDTDMDMDMGMDIQQVAMGTMKMNLETYEKTEK
jgi:hypothetical protein